MNPNQYSEAKELWKAFYASPSFGQAKEAAQHIFVHKMDSDTPLFGALLTAVYVLYAKPFTRADAVGRLDESIVPPNRLVEHREIMKHRHQLHAHD